MGWEGRNDAVEIARQEKNRWKKRALRAEATLAKVREYADRRASWTDQGALPEAYRQRVLSILDESPTERETFADEASIQADADSLAAEIHEAWEFQYDQCDHGTYTGGHLHGEPYAMCRLSAERIVRRRLAKTHGEVVPDDRA